MKKKSIRQFAWAYIDRQKFKKALFDQYDILEAFLAGARCERARTTKPRRK